MDVQVRMTLRKLIEVQVEQNDLAVRIAGAEAQAAMLDHVRMSGARPFPESIQEHRRILQSLRSKFEANQEKMRQLFAEVAAAPSGL